MKRREFLKYSGLATLPLFAGQGLSKSSLKATKMGNSDEIVISVYQRGGADGLQMIPPYADSNYYVLRPGLGIAAPGGGTQAALDLDGFYGLHPAMSALKPIYDAGDMAVIHAAGSPDESHSHFDAQDYMERGILGKSFTTNSGWLGRHLETVDNGNNSAFRGLGHTSRLQLQLYGAVPAVAMNDIEGFTLDVDSAHKTQIQDSLLKLYGNSDLLDQQVSQTFDATDSLAAADPGQYPPDNGAVYQETQISRRFMEVGQLIKADVGLEAVCIDTEGWDHHDGIAGQIDTLLTELSDAMASFYADMGDRMANITIVVMTEFGRRAYENASNGTDHGHGGVMLAIGKGVNGGQVYSDWPGLSASELYLNGDLEVTTDFRLVLGELLDKRMGNQSLGEVFPEYSMPGYLDIFQQT